MQDLELDPPQHPREPLHSQTHQIRVCSGNTPNQSITRQSGSQMKSHFEHSNSASMSMVPAKKIPRYVPSKFVPGDFSESDYASDMEDVRIKPKWTPGAGASVAGEVSDTDSEPVYRPVRPQLKWNEKTTRAASHALESLGQSFAEKAGTAAAKFSQDLVNPTAYRHEQRNIQTGESQDPGLIYFKYDFGYEFGVVMPKESQADDRERSSGDGEDITLPIIHESSSKKK